MLVVFCTDIQTLAAKEQIHVSHSRFYIHVIKNVLKIWVTSDRIKKKLLLVNGIIYTSHVASIRGDWNCIIDLLSKSYAKTNLEDHGVDVRIILNMML